MSVILNKPDILQIMEGCGAKFKSSGRNTQVCCCLLHSEKTPSCSVNLEKQVFYCQGCHAGGDVIRFIELYENISFPDALRRLGIENDRPSLPGPKVQEEQRKQELVRKYAEWERSYFDEIATLYRAWNVLKPMLLPEEIGEHADLFKQESIWEYHLDILSYVGDNPDKTRDKLELYRQYLRQQHKEKERDARIDRAYEKLEAAKKQRGAYANG